MQRQFVVVHAGHRANEHIYALILLKTADEHRAGTFRFLPRFQLPVYAVVDDADIVVVKEKLKQFFNNKQKLVDQLFLKEKIIIKKNLSKENALKYS